MATNFFVYILECRDTTLYTGYTTNVEERLLKHNTGKGAKYTRGRGPHTVKYIESFSTKEAALSREHEIKKLSRQQKLMLIDRYLNGGKENADSIKLSKE